MSVRKIKNPVCLPPHEVKYICTALSESTNWGINKLNVPTTWSITQGEDIVVMVLDTGTPDHKDLTESLILDKCISCIDYNFSDDEDKSIWDHQGHSTHVAGIIGARKNGFGVIGVAPKCKIITVKVLDKDGVGGLDEVNRGLEYSLDIKPNIISMSLGMHLDKALLPVDTTKTDKIIKQLYDMNIPIFAAAGNSGTTGIAYPAMNEHVITIGARDRFGRSAPFTSIGKEMSFSLPGVDIYSTYLKQSYAMLSGTSQATPFCAGICALLLSKHKKQEQETGMNDCKTVPQIIEHFKKYSLDIGESGHDHTYGWGIITDVNGLVTETQMKKEPPLKWWEKIWKWL